MRPNQVGAKQLAPVVGFGPILLELQIVFERPRRQKVQLVLLGGGNPVSGPDEQAEHQRQQQCQQPHDAADHVARAIRRMMFGQPGLQEQPEAAAGEHQHCDADREFNGEHARFLVRPFGEAASPDVLGSPTRSR